MNPIVRAMLNRVLGQEGERAAARFLRKYRGMRILMRNYRGPAGEIDLIARDGDVLVFVEVKTRRAGIPAEAVGPARGVVGGGERGRGAAGRARPRRGGRAGGGAGAGARRRAAGGGGRGARVARPAVVDPDQRARRPLLGAKRFELAAALVESHQV